MNLEELSLHFNKTQIDATAAAVVAAAAPKIYRALLHQSNTDAPVATVLENSLGGTVVWSRIGAGTYLGTLAGAFPPLKTFARIGNTITDAEDNPKEARCILHRSQSDDYVKIETSYNDAGNDSELYYTPIEIMVYR